MKIHFGAVILSEDARRQTRTRPGLARCGLALSEAEGRASESKDPYFAEPYAAAERLFGIYHRDFRDSEVEGRNRERPTRVEGSW